MAEEFIEQPRFPGAYAAAKTVADYVMNNGEYVTSNDENLRGKELRVPFSDRGEATITVYNSVKDLKGNSMDKFGRSIKIGLGPLMMDIDLTESKERGIFTRDYGICGSPGTLRFRESGLTFEIHCPSCNRLNKANAQRRYRRLLRQVSERIERIEKGEILVTNL